MNMDKRKNRNGVIVEHVNLISVVPSFGVQSVNVLCESAAPALFWIVQMQEQTVLCCTSELYALRNEGLSNGGAVIAEITIQVIKLMSWIQVD